jgi:hypothetical protein
VANPSFGMRISVELILSLLAQGETPEAIFADYSDLEPDDLRAGLMLMRSSRITNSTPSISQANEILNRPLRWPSPR